MVKFFKKKAVAACAGFIAAFVLVLGMMAAPSQVMAAITSLDLFGYELAGPYYLPYPVTSEASAVTYNWDTDTLFAVGDEGTAIVEISKTGELISTMSLQGFRDTEGLTYIGDNQFVVIEERLQNAYAFEYTPPEARS